MSWVTPLSRNWVSKPYPSYFEMHSSVVVMRHSHTSGPYFTTVTIVSIVSNVSDIYYVESVSATRTAEPFWTSYDVYLNVHHELLQLSRKSDQASISCQDSLTILQTCWLKIYFLFNNNYSFSLAWDWDGPKKCTWVFLLPKFSGLAWSDEKWTRCWCICT